MKRILIWLAAILAAVFVLHLFVTAAYEAGFQDGFEHAAQMHHGMQHLDQMI